MAQRGFIVHHNGHKFQLGLDRDNTCWRLVWDRLRNGVYTRIRQRIRLGLGIGMIRHLCQVTGRAVPACVGTAERALEG